MTKRRRAKRYIDTGRMARPAQDWDCNERGHMWHSDLVYPSIVVECDWCINCSMVRPGYVNPQEKWDRR